MSAVEVAGQPAPCPFCGTPARRVFSAPRLLFKADPRDTGVPLTDERATLLEYLRAHRLTFEMKCADANLCGN